MLQEWEKENLMQLSKEQLLYLIGQDKHTDFMISNVLIDESKSHISATDAIEKIRKYSCENSFLLRDKNLGSWIDMKEGKITQEKYNEIRFGI